MFHWRPKRASCACDGAFQHQALSPNDAPEKLLALRTRIGMALLIGSAGILVLKNRHAKLEVQKSTRIAASAQTAMPPILRSDPEGMWVAKAIELALNDQA